MFLMNGTYHFPIPEKLLKKSWDSWRRAKKSFEGSVLPVGAILEKVSDDDRDEKDSKTYKTTNLGCEGVWRSKTGREE